MSLVLIGLCQGYYSETRNVNTASGPTQITEHSVLIQVEQSNKFGMSEERIVQVRLSKKHMENGLNNAWNNQKGKQVCMPVFVQTWASKAGNSGFDYWLSGDGMPINLQPAAPKAVA
ncbi:DNA-binding protein [Corynebacterium sp.]|uniref:DNA-binding protein n=1 Tax=Corynebacterium sp. TaxID=1720 RepID=UPI0029007938|nr:DNA-binding protein [Corynebacterium sp.]MDU3111041.1 DNA-binding protein [Corynebacterium sp.]